MWETIDAGSLLRVTMALTGAFLFAITVVSLAKRKMTDSFVLAWGLVSVLFILGGILLHPTKLGDYISGVGMILAGVTMFCVIFGAYFMSVRISELVRRNLELTMQVTLLRQEMTALEAQISEEGRSQDEKNTDRYQYAGARRS